MTARFNAALRTLVLFTLLSVTGAQAAGEEAILLIDQTTGVAGVQRDGKRLALQPGDALQEQDLIVTDRSGRMTLRLGRHGFVEVGPNAEVGVERLPFATYARDLKSIFSVSKGYFRMVWKHPQLSSSWPLYVYMAGHRISLVSGEYFFQNQGKLQQVCVAAGQLALQAAGSENVETIKPPACVRLVPNSAPQVTPRNPDDWIAIRRGFSIEATANTLLAAAPAAPEPPVAAPVKPIITTTPTIIPSVSPPTPIAPPTSTVDVPGNADPELRYDHPTPQLGPVMSAPVLPTPSASPHTVIAPALPPAYSPPGSIAPVATTAPIIIGQVKPVALASPPAKPAATASAPVIATPAPAPAPQASSPVIAKPLPVVAGTGGNWTLNIASYSEAAVAEREAQRLRAAGYAAASTQPATVNGRVWHRVQLGGFASEAEARSAALGLKTQLGLQNIWVLKP